MPFKLICHPPRLTNAPQDEDEDFSGLLQRVFRCDVQDGFDSDVIMLFNEVPIGLQWKYDIGIIAQDIIDYLLPPLLTMDAGAAQVGWPSNTFRTDWDMIWEGTQLDIRTTWYCACGKKGADDTVRLLNQRSTLRVDRAFFVREWQALLWTIIPVLERIAPEATQYPLWSRLLLVAGRPPDDPDRVVRNSSRDAAQG